MRCADKLRDEAERWQARHKEASPLLCNLGVYRSRMVAELPVRIHGALRQRLRHTASAPAASADSPRQRPSGQPHTHGCTFRRTTHTASPSGMTHTRRRTSGSTGTGSTSGGVCTCACADSAESWDLGATTLFHEHRWGASCISCKAQPSLQSVAVQTTGPFPNRARF